LINNEKYTSGVEKQVRDSTNDRKVRLLQVISSTEDVFQYCYGALNFDITIQAIKKGDQLKIDWLPRICTGSRGTFPGEHSLQDLNQIQTFKPKKVINIDKINKTLMHERFGANQKTNVATKRTGPSILCQSNTPHTTISSIYKRPIEIFSSDYSESSEFSEFSEFSENIIV